MDRPTKLIRDHVAARFLEVDALLRTTHPIDPKTGEADKDVPPITPDALGIFFYVASRGTCYKSDMEKHLRLTVASGSRNIDLISKFHRLKLTTGKPRPGHDLIKKEKDHIDQRKTILSLTIKGKKLLTQMKKLLYGEDTDLG